MGVKGKKKRGGRGLGVRHLLQLPSCSPFLDHETLVPLKLEIVPLGSGQGWLSTLLYRIQALHMIRSNDLSA